MNRQTKRMMQRQGQLDEDGSPALVTRQPPSRSAPPEGQRFSPVRFFREVRGELRKVAWASRKEIIKYSLVVLFALVFLITLIYVLDLGFAEAAKVLFQ